MTQKYTKHVLPCSPHTWQWTIPPFTNVFSIQTSTICNEYLQGHGKSSHIGYGITMDNLTHQGLAITGDTMQQKPLIQGIHGPPIKKKRHRKTMGRIGQGLRSLLS